jgi:DNA-binding transcriptional regulator YdaS (Cro superfamily)
MTQLFLTLLMVSSVSLAQSIQGNVKVAPNIANKVTAA